MFINIKFCVFNMVKKLFFVPEFILDSNPQIRKFEKFDKLIDFEEFQRYSKDYKPKNILKELDKESLDKEVFKELGLDKYEKHISYEELKSSSNKVLSDISPHYNPKKFKNEGIRKSVVLKSLHTFVIQFVENTYFKDNFDSYLIDVDKVNDNNYLGYKFLFETRFKYDFLSNLLSYIGNILEYNKYQYNLVIKETSKYRPRGINKLLGMILSDLQNYMSKIVFFYNRERRQIELNLRWVKNYSPESYELSLELIKKIDIEINNLEVKSKEIDKIRSLINRNFLKRLWDSLPPIKRIRGKVSDIEGEIEFK